MSEYIKLRTLTRLSTMGFGQYSQHKVGNILKSNPNYLVWVYYNLDRITFIEEILLELKISKDNQIKKPGKITEEAFSKLMEIKRSQIIKNSDNPILLSKRLEESTKKKNKAKLKDIDRKENFELSKCTLAARNKKH